MLWRGDGMTKALATGTWRGFVARFLGVFAGGLAAVSLFVLLVDPYGVMPFSLPIERPIVSISQRHVYPQAVQSGRFDSIILGTSTSRLLDPESLNAPFGARVFNAAMNNAMAWEQKLIFDKFVDKVAAPKLVLVGLDTVWCRADADQNRFGYPDFPHWMYDANPWNDALHLVNASTLEIAGRIVGWHLGLYRERVRRDGFGVFTPPEESYDAARASANVWRDRPDRGAAISSAVALPEAERRQLALPAVPWLDAMLARLPSSTMKILAYMPVHVAAQPAPGSREAAIEAECKERIAAVARRRGARVVDWRIASALTREDTNYWDALHFRLPIAERVARETSQAALQGREAADGSYRLLTP
jgi:hypothetical protein